ncbi:MAG: hypothetical protein AB1782_16210 [Cyanobacteriota bacterium]
MLLNKKLLFILIFFIASGAIYAQGIVPMAPSMDITGKTFEPADGSISPFDLSSITSQENQNTDKVKTNLVDKTNMTPEYKDETNNNNSTSELASTSNNLSSNLNESTKNIDSVTEEPESMNNTQESVNISSLNDTTPANNIEGQLIEDKKIEESIEAGENEYMTSIPTFNPSTNRPFVSHNTGIRKEADEIEFELRLEEKRALRDLRILWSSAIEKSTTIRLAIQKLSNPDEAENIDKSIMSKMLSPLASLAPMAMMASSSASQTAGALIGGGMLGTLASDVDNEYNRALLRVSDYDLIMLAKEVDELQAKIVINYYEYYHALQRMIESEKAMEKAYELYVKAQETNNFAANTAADAFYREAKQNYLNSKHNFLSARTALEQISGNDAIVYIENLKDEDPAFPEDPNQQIAPVNNQPVPPETTIQPAIDNSNNNTDSLQTKSEPDFNENISNTKEAQSPVEQPVVNENPYDQLQ